MTRAGLIAIVCLTANPALAQFTGLSRTEIQVGNTPFSDPATLTTAFEQLNLRYDAGPLRAAIRSEAFLSGRQERRYVQLSQVRVDGSYGGFRASVGHFYEMLGRGLLLRGFEIPGAVYEDAAFRVRQSFQRDIEGARLGWSNRHVDLLVLRGRPLVSVLPPTVDRAARRPDLVSAALGGLRVGPARIAGHYLRNETDTETRDYASVSGEWSAGGYSAYAELATLQGDQSPLLRGNHALYLATAYGRIGFGVSLEYKDYSDFFLGSGFNDPPSLVREHSWVTLNRSTHVLNAVDETGYQGEVYGLIPGIGTLTLNATRAENELAPGFAVVYREYYAELATFPIGRTSGRVFVDVAEDELKGQRRRRSVGTYLDRKLGSPWAASLQLEAQRYRMEFLDDALATNLVAAVVLSRSSTYSAGITIERSTDLFLTDDPRTAEIEEAPRYWLGVNFGWRPSRRHSLALFAGTRRGGPACTSGICYEVLDFEGAEMRLTSRF